MREIGQGNSYQNYDFGGIGTQDRCNYEEDRRQRTRLGIDDSHQDKSRGARQNRGESIAEITDQSAG